MRTGLHIVSSWLLLTRAVLGCAAVIGIDHDYSDRDDSRLASGGSEAAGSAGTADESSGGAGTSGGAGLGSAAGASGSAGGLGNAGALGTSCSGVSWQGICWYLGRPGASCTQSCQDHAGNAPSAEALVGVAAQGGSLSQCSALFDLLGSSLAPTAATRADGLGLGCHRYGSKNYWLSSPRYDATAANRSARLVCGCRE